MAYEQGRSATDVSNELITADGEAKSNDAAMDWRQYHALQGNGVFSDSLDDDMDDATELVSSLLATESYSTTTDDTEFVVGNESEAAAGARKWRRLHERFGWDASQVDAREGLTAKPEPSTTPANINVPTADLHHLNVALWGAPTRPLQVILGQVIRQEEARRLAIKQWNQSAYRFYLLRNALEIESAFNATVNAFRLKMARLITFSSYEHRLHLKKMRAQLANVQRHIGDMNTFIINYLAQVQTSQSVYKRFMDRHNSLFANLITQQKICMPVRLREALTRGKHPIDVFNHPDYGHLMSEELRAKFIEIYKLCAERLALQPSSPPASSQHYRLQMQQAMLAAMLWEDMVNVAEPQITIENCAQHFAALQIQMQHVAAECCDVELIYAEVIRTMREVQQQQAELQVRMQQCRDGELDVLTSLNALHLIPAQKTLAKWWQTFAGNNDVTEVYCSPNNAALESGFAINHTSGSILSGSRDTAKIATTTAQYFRRVLNF